MGSLVGRPRCRTFFKRGRPKPLGGYATLRQWLRGDLVFREREWRQHPWSALWI